MWSEELASHDEDPPVVGGFPIIVEIVDTLEKLDGFRPLVDAVIEERLATVERVQICFYRSGKRAV